MSKTRRQRALEHPGLPKPGVRDPRRIKNMAAVVMGQAGGLAPHKSRGVQSLPKAARQAIAKRAAETRRLNKEMKRAV